MNDLERKWADAGLKMTNQRRTILGVLAQATDHPSVEDLYQRAKQIDSSVSIATVYRTLHILDELNLVQKHEFNKSFSRFEVNDSHHHHLVDVDSGEVIEFEDDKLELLKAEIAARLGFELVDDRLELYGRRLKRS
jgi:Fur family ferric uptake transcriptional regulator